MTTTGALTHTLTHDSPPGILRQIEAFRAPMPSSVEKRKAKRKRRERLQGKGHMREIASDITG